MIRSLQDKNGEARARQMQADPRALCLMTGGTGDDRFLLNRCVNTNAMKRIQCNDVQRAPAATNNSGASNIFKRY